MACLHQELDIAARISGPAQCQPELADRFIQEKIASFQNGNGVES